MTTTFLFLLTVPALAVDFDRDVAPLLIRRCLECHSGAEPQGKLDLTSLTTAQTGGESGAAIVAGKPAESLLLQRVIAGEMPPAKEGRSQKLPESEIATLRTWIAAGAVWPQNRRIDLFEKTTDRRAGLDWWSLQPIRRVSPPPVKQSENVANPLDAFLFAKLEEKGWEPAPLADRRTLIRRVHADLWGLPPTFDEVEAFVRDERPSAYEELIDRLLVSPRFGERWARYWLDTVRFAETCGYERDQTKPQAWRYRDWVIRAFTEDKPFDRFILEQLAGDELPDRSEDTLVATGFIRLGTWNDEPNDPQEYKYDRLEDMVHATTSAFLALTVKCSRCHDHKFDPIRQTDYYRVANAFWAGFIEPGPRELQGGPDKGTLGSEVFGWTDRGREPPPLRLLKKGDIHRPGDVVPPAHLSFQPTLDRPLSPPAANAKTTQRRLQLAQWIADPANPLTARVWVNRLWQQHFGQGLVRSPDNFGFTGDAPTHPELLDWLATEFRERGFRSRPLHKLILMSRAYRQSSLHPRHEAYSQSDANNRLWWRAERRRLDADAIRDSLLAASGNLDLTSTSGPSFSPPISADALEGLSMKGNAWKVSPAEEQGRRSIFIFTKRSLLPPLLTVFDAPDTTLPCGKRDVSTVAPQALALLNNSFVHEQSESLARRVQRTGADPRQQVEQAWRIALGRSPRTSEVEAALAHLHAQTARFGGQQSDLPPVGDELPVTEKLVLHLRADRGVAQDDAGRVRGWEDGSAGKHGAVQETAAARPLFVADAIGTRPALRFDGQGRFLSLSGQVLTSQTNSLFAVVSDQGKPGHREIFSNWNANGNVFSSLFLGLTGTDTVRLSDDFSNAGVVRNRERPFLLAAINGSSDAVVFQNDARIGRKPAPLGARRLDFPYVIGQQGNINGEFWHGDLAEIAIFDRAVSDTERQRLATYFARRYQLSATPPADARFLALASLCHVLLNSNEFVYVD